VKAINIHHFLQTYSAHSHTLAILYLS
jgi:hypothetical protein